MILMVARLRMSVVVHEEGGGKCGLASWRPVELLMTVLNVWSVCL